MKGNVNTATECFHLAIFFSMSILDVPHKQYLNNDVDNRRGFEITQF